MKALLLMLGLIATTGHAAPDDLSAKQRQYCQQTADQIGALVRRMQYGESTTSVLASIKADNKLSAIQEATIEAAIPVVSSMGIFPAAVDKMRVERFGADAGYLGCVKGFTRLHNAQLFAPTLGIAGSK